MRKLESDFDLVLISELMDESLVLMAHSLCLPLHRVASPKKNARKQEARVGIMFSFL